MQRKTFTLRMMTFQKPVVTCGDFNVAHNEIDLKNPGPNRGNAGFSDEERESFTRLLDAGGQVLVDERDLWPDGRFVTTNLIVHPDFLAEHPDVVRGLVTGQVEANEWLNANPEEAQAVVGDAIAEALIPVLGRLAELR